MIRINLVGRLGNHLYQYAACRTLANKLGYNYYVGFGKNYHFGRDVAEPNNIFELFDVDHGTLDGSINNRFFSDQVLDNIIKSEEPEKADLLLNIQDNTLLNGFFENPYYFNIDQVNEWFKLKHEIIPNYDIDNTCVIHFRGTDFKDIILDKNYYLNAIKYININNYLIVTDDIKLATEYFSFLENKKIVSGNIVEDFCVMTYAKYLIGSNSTFSHWAVYLNKHKFKITLPMDIRRFYPIEFIKFI